uniref:Dynein axonemal intermediate chain 4 n=1 Tax=Varanus komodoensis TaxID=61221 RepID=A0A8D2IVE3_VARKO
ICFCFQDTNIYMAGTEEGYIHKCFCSYNEQYLETYRGHKGPVYKIAWNPFSTEVFLSCSADWSIILWRQDSVRPVLAFSSTTNVIYDIMWSPNSAYVFAAVNETRVEIWDLSVSTLDPLIVNPATGNLKFTTVLFAKNTDCLLLGDSDGFVTVYALRDMAALDRKKLLYHANSPTKYIRGSWKKNPEGNLMQKVLRPQLSTLVIHNFFLIS